MIRHTGHIIVNSWYDLSMIYGYIYKTVLPDGRTYIGQKKGNTIKEDYFGSSKHLSNWFMKNIGYSSIKCPKYFADIAGVIRIIIAYAIDQDELDTLERYFIYLEKSEQGKEFCLNIREGGYGAYYKEFSKEGQERKLAALADQKNRKKALETRHLRFEAGLYILSEETLKKRSDGIKRARKKKPVWNKGLTAATDERCKKLAWKDREKLKEELKEANKKSVAVIKGSKWWNNGIIQVRAKECPEGFTHGMLNWKKC